MGAWSYPAPAFQYLEMHKVRAALLSESYDELSSFSSICTTFGTTSFPALMLSPLLFCSFTGIFVVISVVIVVLVMLWYPVVCFSSLDLWVPICTVAWQLGNTWHVLLDGGSFLILAKSQHLDALPFLTRCIQLHITRGEKIHSYSNTLQRLFSSSIVFSSHWGMYIFPVMFSAINYPHAPMLLWQPAQHIFTLFFLCCLCPSESLCWFLFFPGLSDPYPLPFISSVAAKCIVFNCFISA